MANPYIFPAGTQLYYTTKSTQVSSTITPDALPSTYPLSGGDVGTDPDVTWVSFGCVKSISGLAQLVPETTEHRCINGASGLIEKIGTGFFTPTTVTMKLSFDQTEFTVFDGMVEGREVIRMLIVFPVRSDHTLPFRMAFRYYVNGAAINMDSLTEEIALDLTLELAFDSGVKEVGS